LLSESYAEAEVVMIENYTVQHYEHVSTKSYDELVREFETAVGNAEHGELAKAGEAAANRSEWEANLNALFGSSGFMRVFSIDHGNWLGFYGVAAKAKKYVFGNPIVAWSMLRHDLRAGAQVPLSLMIYETPGGEVRVSYDLPSSVLGFIHDDDLAEAASGLDAKLTAFVAELAGADA
jgi:uncharacterized protein (DUF302 family)